MNKKERKMWIRSTIGTKTKSSNTHDKTWTLALRRPKIGQKGKRGNEHYCSLQRESISMRLNVICNTSKSTGVDAILGTYCNSEDFSELSPYTEIFNPHKIYLSS